MCVLVLGCIGCAQYVLGECGCVSGIRGFLNYYLRKFCVSGVVAACLFSCLGVSVNYLGSGNLEVYTIAKELADSEISKTTSKDKISTYMEQYTAAIQCEKVSLYSPSPSLHLFFSFPGFVSTRVFVDDHHYPSF